MKRRTAKIAIDHVCLALPRDGSDARPDLQEINLEVHESEFLCIVGSRGCGMSVLLNAAAGFLQPIRGAVRVDGVAVKSPSPQQILISQRDGVFPWLSVEENVGLGVYELSPGIRREVVSHYIEMLGLSEYERSYPAQLSSDVKLRVELARALAAGADILYLDDPFGALDSLSRLRMRAELAQICQREKKTVLFATHDVDEAVQLADRIVVMGAHPATVRSILDVPLPRPRDIDSAPYMEMRREVFSVMGLNHSDLPALLTGGSRQKKFDADVIIMGGGPAGSVLGTYLARAGIDHIIIDKVHHPRPHVGESLDCSAMKVLHEIDFLPVMAQEEFIVRGGMCWSPHDGTEIDLDFRALGGPGYAYHVDRAKFDELLFKHARSHGSRTLTGVQVERVDFNRQGATGVTGKVGESRLTLKSRLVVDATGRQAVLGRQLNIMKSDPEFRQFAVHNWFAGMDRGGGKAADYTHVHSLPMNRGWVWQIPITNDITSIGVVVDRDHFIKAGADIAEYFQSLIRLNPRLAQRMTNAKPVREFRMDGNYSYTMDRFVGPGWLMIGDAAFFIDPIFSSGVSIALHSAKFAASMIAQALSTDNLNAGPLAAYEGRMDTAAGIWRDFVRLFYEHSSDFGRVLVDLPFRADALRLCEGDVYEDAAAETLTRLKKEFSSVEGKRRWLN